MKKTAVLNAPLSNLIASLGHTQSLVICDAGLPISRQTPSIDLALTSGVPDFITTLKTIISELFVEKALLAEEIKQHNPLIHTTLLTILKQLEQQQGNKISIEYTPHTDFKFHTGQSQGIVRTGECSPYANVILYSGVPF
ncbi:D-ribose pyranase [Mergibacter septicus]|uniref:D-ribose pyranase n=1 Tax=Mergibacter septicus TaxID=221402 RepID=A0A8D4IYY9_9PAST|nr:D-ribose pyranase [Mergibacter septicus]AWX15911.1 D-ribose pyranase [Mergibacter septicus]QDJ13387.1 D-ribose pyranase [Mergibacter septicus]QDJ15164.1 D-ribose pyranase [Mergibacter septicus]UTU47413.1 D-ribose pyranase [Mergibacter septicus]WMR95405.1 D-ribose pyranase [Mergibacter septicus]